MIEVAVRAGQQPPLPALRSVLSLDIVDGSVRFGKYQNWKVCPEQSLPGTLLL
jgi:hypothetical protein